MSGRVLAGAMAGALLLAGVGLGALRQVTDDVPTQAEATRPFPRPSTTTSSFPPVAIPSIGAPEAWDPTDGPLFPEPAPEPEPASREERPAPSPSTTSTPLPAATSSAPAPAPPPPAPPAAPEPEAEPGLIGLVNRARAEAGCGPLTIDPDLQRLAEEHAARQAAGGAIYHSEPPGQYAAWGENVASGADTEAAVHEAWMASQGHRDNIENCGYTLMGVGSAVSADGVRYWTQQFGRLP